jgi:hypothetical protein
VPVGAAAASSQQGHSSPDEPPQQHISRLSEGGRQLLGVTALAFFTVGCGVAGG